MLYDVTPWREVARHGACMLTLDTALACGGPSGRGEEALADVDVVPAEGGEHTISGNQWQSDVDVVPTEGGEHAALSKSRHPGP